MPKSQGKKGDGGGSVKTKSKVTFKSDKKKDGENSSSTMTGAGKPSGIGTGTGAKARGSQIISQKNKGSKKGLPKDKDAPPPPKGGKSVKGKVNKKGKAKESIASKASEMSIKEDVIEEPEVPEVDVGIEIASAAKTKKGKKGGKKGGKAKGTKSKSVKADKSKAKSKKSGKSKEERIAEKKAAAEKMMELEATERPIQLMQSMEIIESYDKWIMRKYMKAKKEQEWRAFKRCSNIPDFNKIYEVNAYMSNWLSQLDPPSLKQWLRMTPEYLKLLSELQRWLTIPPETMRVDLLKQLGILYRKMRNNHTAYLDKCTYAIISDLTPYYELEDGICDYFLSIPEVAHCIWSNLYCSPNITGHEFEELNFKFKIPGKLIDIPGLYRLVKTEYDYYSDSCLSYFPPGVENPLKQSNQDWIDSNKPPPPEGEEEEDLVDKKKKKKKKGKGEKVKVKGTKSKKGKGNKKKGKGGGITSATSEEDIEDLEFPDELEIGDTKKKKKNKEKKPKKAKKDKSAATGLGVGISSGEESSSSLPPPQSDGGGKKKKKVGKPDKKEKKKGDITTTDESEPPSSTASSKASKKSKKKTKKGKKGKGESGGEATTSGDEVKVGGGSITGVGEQKEQITGDEGQAASGISSPVASDAGRSQSKSPKGRSRSKTKKVNEKGKPKSKSPGARDTATVKSKAETVPTATTVQSNKKPKKDNNKDKGRPQSKSPKRAKSKSPGGRSAKSISATATEDEDESDVEESVVTDASRSKSPKAKKEVKEKGEGKGKAKGRGKSKSPKGKSPEASKSEGVPPSESKATSTTTRGRSPSKKKMKDRGASRSKSKTGKKGKKTEAEMAKAREREEKAKFIPPLHANELNLRNYTILGGIFQFGLYEIPPQPSTRGNWVIHMRESDERLKELSFEADYVPPPPEPEGTKKSPEEMEREAKQQEEELQKLILTDMNQDEDILDEFDIPKDPEEEALMAEKKKAEAERKMEEELERKYEGLLSVYITAPSTALWFEPPVPVFWDPENMIWTTNGFYDIRFNESSLQLSFRTTRFGTFALGHNRWSNLPYQSWELRPMGKNKVSFTLTAAIAVVEFTVMGDQICVSSLGNVTNSGDVEAAIINKYMKPQKLIKTMRYHGLDIFPELDSYAYVDGVLVKHIEMEDHLYQCMAIVSSAFNFQWSRWNMLAGREKMVYQMRERHGLASPGNYNTVLTTPRKAIRIDVTEVSPNYSESPVEQLEYFADLLNLARGINTQEGIRIMNETNPYHIETVRMLLTSIRPLSFS